jgi:hypothetical protein
MKLNVVPASAGVLWVKLGIRTFFRQPLALVGLFFLFMAAVSVASLVPFLGTALALGLLPAVTVGFMAATEIAAEGKFPMPIVLLTAFRAGREQARAMLILGVLYALGFLLVMGLSALVDGGQFARLYLVGGTINTELVSQPGFQGAMWLALGLYLPLSLLFWHAPALVHWHGISPVKALFFSAVACLRNFWAFTVYGLLWMGIFLGFGLALSIITSLLGQGNALGAMIIPVALVLAAMFFSSIYFTFRDNFVQEAGV